MRGISGKYRRYAEECVIGLPLLLNDVDIKKAELEALALNDGIQSISWDNIGHSSSISDLTGRTALHNLERQDELVLEIKELERKIKKIVTAITDLPKTQNIVISMFYLGNDKPSWAEIGSTINFSVAHSRRFRSWALDSIARALYGLDAMEDKRFLEIK